MKEMRTYGSKQNNLHLRSVLWAVAIPRSTISLGIITRTKGECSEYGKVLTQWKILSYKNRKMGICEGEQVLLEVKGA